MNYTGAASIMVQGVNTCGSSESSTSFDVTVFPYTGISEPTKEKFVSIYPNPAKGTINLIPSGAYKVDIRIMNAVGNSILSIEDIHLSSSYKLDISGLAPGIYFITIADKVNRQVTKLIVE